MYKTKTSTKAFQFILGFLIFTNVLGILLYALVPDFIEIIRSFVILNLLSFFLFESKQKEKAKANGEFPEPGQTFKVVLPDSKWITVAISITFLLSMILVAYYSINADVIKAAMYALISFLIYINIAEKRFQQIGKRKNKEEE